MQHLHVYRYAAYRALQVHHHHHHHHFNVHFLHTLKLFRFRFHNSFRPSSKIWNVGSVADSILCWDSACTLDCHSAVWGPTSAVSLLQYSNERHSPLFLKPLAKLETGRYQDHTHTDNFQNLKKNHNFQFSDDKTRWYHQSLCCARCVHYPWDVMPRNLRDEDLKVFSSDVMSGGDAVFEGQYCRAGLNCEFVRLWIFRLINWTNCSQNI